MGTHITAAGRTRTFNTVARIPQTGTRSHIGTAESELLDRGRVADRGHQKSFRRGYRSHCESRWLTYSCPRPAVQVSGREPSCTLCTRAASKCPLPRVQALSPRPARPRTQYNRDATLGLRSPAHGEVGQWLTCILADVDQLSHTLNQLATPRGALVGLGLSLGAGGQ